MRMFALTKQGLGWTLGAFDGSPLGLSIGPLARGGANCSSAGLVLLLLMTLCGCSDGGQAEAPEAPPTLESLMAEMAEQYSLPSAAEVRAWEPLGISSPEAVQMAELEREWRSRYLRGQVESDEALELGMIYARSEKAERARRLLVPLLEVVPNESRLHTYLGMTYLSGGDYPEAELLLRHALTMDSRSATAHALLGQTLVQQGRDADARLPLTEANQLDPTLLLPSLELARILEEGDSGERAARVLEGLVRRYPSDPRALFRLERIRRNQGRVLEADELSKRHARAIQIDDLALNKMKLPPGGVETLLARHYVQVGQYEMALEEIDDARRRRPGGEFDVLILALSADAHWHLGRPTEAQACLEKLRERFPTNPLTADIEAMLSGEDPSKAELATMASSEPEDG